MISTLPSFPSSWPSAPWPTPPPPPELSPNKRGLHPAQAVQPLPQPELPGTLEWPTLRSGSLTSRLRASGDSSSTAPLRRAERGCRWQPRGERLLRAQLCRRALGLLRGGGRCPVRACLAPLHRGLRAPQAVSRRLRRVLPLGGAAARPVFAAFMLDSDAVFRGATVASVISNGRGRVLRGLANGRRPLG